MPATLHYYEPYSQSKNMEALAKEVRAALEKFYNESQDEPINVYNMVMAEVEKPLIQAVMKYTGHNQSKAAEVLGLNRGTFRKKLAIYGML